MARKRAAKWQCRLGGRLIGSRSSLLAAMHIIERPYYMRGYATVTNGETGEHWERIGGSWFKKRAAAPRNTGEA